MIKKIIITLLIISPIVILALEFYSSPSRTDPLQVLVGTWATEAKIPTGNFQIFFNLQPLKERLVMLPCIMHTSGKTGFGSSNCWVWLRIILSQVT
jgi:hypothetical protein